MTDLERLWDDYPTGKAPVREILASAAGAQRRQRRLLTRPLLTAVGVTGLAGAFVAGTLVAGDSSGGDGTPPGAEALPRHVAFQADLAPAKSCDELLDVYQTRALELVGAWGWRGGDEQAYAMDGALPRGAWSENGSLALRDRSTSELQSLVKAPQTERQVNSDTGTNVQEAGVDEPDTVKTDGKVLTMVRDDALVTYDVTGTSTEQLSSIALPGIEDAEILLSGDTVVAIGADDRASRATPASRVLRISLADPAEPSITDDVVYDAALSSARQHGDTVRIVLSSGLPDLSFVEPGEDRSAKAAKAANRKLVTDSTIEDWLPTITAGSGDKQGKAKQLLDCTNVALPSDDLPLATTSVVGFATDAPEKVDAIGLAGAAPIAYESADHLFLAASGGWGPWFTDCAACTTVVMPSGAKPTGTSYLFDFALDGTRATHVASGEIEGSIEDRWAIDEADGILRVAVGPTSETGNFNSILTLERKGKQLVEHGRLDRLGPNEEIKSVRWFDDLAVLVTYRRVDPLYAVDLTDTGKPVLLGKLKIPGFSSYLHPLGSWRMIGVGEGPDGKGGWGAQIGLFNVRDITKVHRMDVHNYGRNTHALAGLDPRAFTWLPDHRTVITVLEKQTGRRVGYLSVLKLKDGKLHQRLVQVEYGDDVDDVRAVPMPDGRVVVVTGEKAQFFEL